MMKHKNKRTWWYKSILIIALSCVMLSGILSGCGSEASGDAGLYDADAENDSVDMEADDAAPADGAGALSADELLLAIQDSTTAGIELVYDSAQSEALPQERLDALKELFAAGGVTPIDYPYMFIPEYRVSFDSGVSYVLMQDAADFENRMVVLQFDGDDTIYSASYDIFRYSKIGTEWANDMAYMHIFADGDSDEAGLLAAIDSGDVKYAASLYYTGLGVALAQEDVTVRIDDYYVVEMSDTDPNLMSVLIVYSVKPESMGALQFSADLAANPNLSEADGWITGNIFVGAFYKESTDSGTRIYILGLEPFMYEENGADQTEVTKILYENSSAAYLA